MRLQLAPYLRKPTPIFATATASRYYSSGKHRIRRNVVRNNEKFFLPYRANLIGDKFIFLSTHMNEENFKRCPFCAEEIKSDAIKCKHCKSNLDGAIVAQQDEQKQSGSFRLTKNSSKPKEGLFLQSMNCGCAVVFIFIAIIIILAIVAS